MENDLSFVTINTESSGFTPLSDIKGGDAGFLRLNEGRNEIFLFGLKGHLTSQGKAYFEFDYLKSERVQAQQLLDTPVSIVMMGVNIDGITGTIIDFKKNYYLISEKTTPSILGISSENKIL